MTGRARKCINMLRECQNIQGDVFELGVGAGTTTIELGKFIKQEKLDKKVFAFDTFKGFPYAESKHLYKGKKYGRGFKNLKSKLLKNNIKDIVIPVVGKVEDNLKNQVLTNPCFVWFDLDLYRSTSLAYKILENRIPKNGIIGFHDYKFKTTPGIQEVVDNELDKNKFKKILKKTNSIFFRRV